MAFFLFYSLHRLLFGLRIVLTNLYQQSIIWQYSNPYSVLIVTRTLLVCNPSYICHHLVLRSASTKIPSFYTFSAVTTNFSLYSFECTSVEYQILWSFKLWCRNFYNQNVTFELNLDPSPEPIETLYSPSGTKVYVPFHERYNISKISYILRSFLKFQQLRIILENISWIPWIVFCLYYIRLG